MSQVKISYLFLNFVILLWINFSKKLDKDGKIEIGPKFTIKFFCLLLYNGTTLASLRSDGTIPVINEFIDNY